MPGIVEVVEQYKGEIVVLQKDVLDREVFKFEFDSMYRQLGIEAKLAEDINRLSSDLLSSYQGKLPSNEISNAVIIQLNLLRLEAEHEYTHLRKEISNRDAVFEDSLTPLLELIQAVQSGNIKSHQFYLRLKGYLDNLVEEGLMPWSPPLT
ncbi:hypothetical protein J4448_07390 [Candidatus Woesearchaeota archaeon]|nr:hypothetical protein [Candidatus Woesearchaeota archaeon]